MTRVIQWATGVTGLMSLRHILDRPDLTAQRFIADPFGKQAGATMYRTAEMSGGGSAPNQRQRSIDSSI